MTVIATVTADCAVCSAGFTELGSNECVSCSNKSSVVTQTVIKALAALALLCCCLALAREQHKQQLAAAREKTAVAEGQSKRLQQHKVKSAFGRITVCTLRIFERLRIPLVVYQVSLVSSWPKHHIVEIPAMALTTTLQRLSDVL
jgi:hypothetical protein